MKNTILSILTLILLPACLFAVDGQVLISQTSVTAGGGFPYVITQPGSYKLSGNLTPPTGVDAIHISSNNVTLDLNGFTIGSATCIPDSCNNPLAFGVRTNSSQEYYDITVRNGMISGVGYGVYLYGDSFTVEDLHVRNVTLIGIWTSSVGGRALSVLIRRNNVQDATTGLQINGSGLTTDNTFSNNSVGAEMNPGGSDSIPSLVKGNTFVKNGTSLLLYHGGYANNVFTDPPAFGTNLGGNLCGTAVCP